MDETGDLCSYSADRFFLISVETDIQLREKEQNTDESWQPWKIIQVIMIL